MRLLHTKNNVRYKSYAQENKNKIKKLPQIFIIKEEIQEINIHLKRLEKNNKKK